MDILFDTSKKRLAFEDGGLVFMEDRLDEVIQRLFIRFKTFKREWFWNELYGIDYLNDVFGKGRSKFSVDMIIQNAILDEPLVLRIDYFTSEIVNYRYSCAFRLQTVEGDIKSTIYLLVNEDGIQLTNENGRKLAAKFSEPPEVSPTITEIYYLFDDRENQLTNSTGRYVYSKGFMEK